MNILPPSTPSYLLEITLLPLTYEDLEFIKVVTAFVILGNRLELSNKYETLSQ